MYKARNTIIAGVLGWFCLIFSAISAAAERPVIVGFHQKPGISEEALVHGKGGKVKRTFSHLRSMAAEMSDLAIDELRKDRRIAYIEDDAIIGAVVPVAMSIEYQNAWGVGRINAETAYNNGVTGAGVKVAVLDTGMDYTHPELAARYAGGYDFVNNNADPFDDSYNSHGTHVAGIIAAERNDTGVVGVAPQASLYAVKVLNGAMIGFNSDLLAGIDWAIANGMQVINMSISAADSQSLQDACDAAYQSGVILVAAAGNSDGGALVYPAAYPSVIAVSATDQNNLAASFSAVGPEVEISAPGVGIYSTVVPDTSCPPDEPSCCFGQSYCYLSGTSQAAPHVTGVVALIISSGFGLDLNGDGISDNNDVRLQLQATAKDLGMQGRDAIYGFGLVQAAPAAPEPPPAITLHLVVPDTKGKPACVETCVDLSDGIYEVTIVNTSLTELSVEVYESGQLVNILSRDFRFRKQSNQQVFTLDAQGTTYQVVFKPEGKRGSFADVSIQQMQ